MTERFNHRTRNRIAAQLRSAKLLSCGIKVAANEAQAAAELARDLEIDVPIRVVDTPPGNHWLTEGE
ncbi:hypothetical protein [Ruegeria sp. HKCCC2117]|uniref:hypothetical protein n=1 Tax=Ruegeria sp. HKCCC2117 TaxID=2682992 RepID=UPI0014886338|nr:hypothetical protein [Ruegeria sp. HKCCC2117]